MWWKAIRKFSVYESDPPKSGDDPPEDPPGGGDPPKDPPKDPPEPVKISADILPEDLKGLPEAEIKFHLTQMVSALSASSEKIGTLERELRAVQAPPKKEEPKEPDKPLEEMILEDPEAAVMVVLERAGLVDRFSRLESQVGESAFTIIAAKVPNFAEYEDSVRAILKESKVLSTPENIMGALQMSIGRKALENEEREARKKLNTVIPKDTPPEDPTDHPAMTALEKEIFGASDMTEDEWFKNKAGGFDIKVPTS